MNKEFDFLWGCLIEIFFCSLRSWLDELKLELVCWVLLVVIIKFDSWLYLIVYIVFSFVLIVKFVFGCNECWKNNNDNNK